MSPFWSDEFSRVCFEVFAVTAGLFGLLGVWAALSPRHWFIRALVVVVASSGMLLIRADEPMLLVLLSSSATAFVLRFAQRSVHVAAESPVPKRSTRRILFLI